MWLLLILIVVFIAWHFFPAPRPPAPAPRFRNDLRIHTGTPEWRSIVDEHAESPAETAFLEAIINAYQLQPRLGSLQGNGLKLDFQVEEGCYRMDFLANDWLVIEIDGAAWHSSPEAQARDRKRDSYFEGLGYTVVRIPAKVVFETPDIAVQRVRSALTVGKRVLAEPEPIDGFRRLGQTMSSIASGLDEANKFVRRQQYVATALSQPNMAFEQERSLLDVAISGAESALSREELLRDPQLRAYYEESYAELKSFMGGSPPPSEMGDLDFAPIPFGLPDEIDPDMRLHVQHAYDLLQRQRDEIFVAARRKMENEPRLKQHVLAFLRQI